VNGPKYRLNGLYGAVALEFDKKGVETVEGVHRLFEKLSEKLLFFSVQSSSLPSLLALK
jgi:hypothetical protein